MGFRSLFPVKQQEQTNLHTNAFCLHHSGKLINLWILLEHKVAVEVVAVVESSPLLRGFPEYFLRSPFLHRDKHERHLHYF